MEGARHTYLPTSTSLHTLLPTLLRTCLLRGLRKPSQGASEVPQGVSLSFFFLPLARSEVACGSLDDVHLLDPGCACALWPSYPPSHPHTHTPTTPTGKLSLPTTCMYACREVVCGSLGDVQAVLAPCGLGSWEVVRQAAGLPPDKSPDASAAQRKHKGF